MTTGPSTGNANDSTTLGSPTGTDDSATMTTGSGGMDSPACCTPGQACEIAKITGCVCDERPACCEGEWDLSCVATGVALGCIDRACMSPPTSCCAQSDQPGCDDFEIMACVCADHLTCCTQEWNGTCVMAVEECPEVQCP